MGGGRPPRITRQSERLAIAEQLGHFRGIEACYGRRVRIVGWNPRDVISDAPVGRSLMAQLVQKVAA